MDEKDKIEKESAGCDKARLDEALDIFVQMRAVDKAKGFQRIVEPVNRGVRRHRLIVLGRWVAVIVLVMTVGLFWMVRDHATSSIPVMQTQEITPGGMKAKLILATGENVLLDTLVLDTMTIREAGVMIQKSGGVLTYENSGKKDERPVKITYNTLDVPRGGEYDVVLEDGTRVWLNADSRLKYPVVFPGNERRVILEGEAYFEVARDTSRPFLVETGIQALRVLGTAFNVCAYPDEIYRTTLLEGCVEVLYKKEVVKLQPNEQWVLDGGVGCVVPVNERMAASWKNGSFAFDDEPLSDVFQELERWYDVHVFIANEEIRDMKFTGIFPRYADMDKVLNIVELATGVSCKVNNRTIVISKYENKSGK